MKIREYDDVDPLGVLHLNLLSLGFALTPERAARIRRLDPRPFPFLAVYAIKEGGVAGQVGVFRLPVVTAQGPEDVGGVWAVCTHPAFSGRGVATRLLDEAHARMRAAGLRFSTLGTARHRGAHQLYRRQGYADVASYPSAAARRDTALLDTPLRAERAGVERLRFADELFRQIAGDRLGFARRHEPFFSTMAEIGAVSADEVWLLWDGGGRVGYAQAGFVGPVLVVRDLLLRPGVDAAAAVAALVRACDAPYLRVGVPRPDYMTSLRRAGYQLARPGWGTFMLKPLADDVTLQEARGLLGVGTDRFLLSSLDTT